MTTIQWGLCALLVVLVLWVCLVGWRILGFLHTYGRHGGPPWERC